MPVVTSIDWPSARVTTAFFVVRALPEEALEALGLAPNLDRVDAGHLNVEQAFDGGLDSGLGASERTRKVTWLCSEPRVAFSVITGARITP